LNFSGFKNPNPSACVSMTNSGQGKVSGNPGAVHAVVSPASGARAETSTRPALSTAEVVLFTAGAREPIRRVARRWSPLLRYRREAPRSFLFARDATVQVPRTPREHSRRSTLHPARARSTHR
jgi:hypothetical protein